MKFTQTLKEENARFAEDRKRAEEQHEQACLQAKRNLLENVLKFAQGHFIGEVLVDETQRTIDGDWSTYTSFCTYTNSFLGRYFAINGKPTNHYLLMERKKHALLLFTGQPVVKEQKQRVLQLFVLKKKILLL